MSNLCDDRLIEQAKKTHVIELEPLYWILEDAITDGKIEIAKSVYDSFLYLAEYNKSILPQGLQPAQIYRLKQIAYEIYGNGSYICKKQEIVMRQSISSTKIPFEKEDDLRNYLASRPNILSNAFKDDVVIKNTEFIIDHNYRCDIIAQSKKKLYIVELKIVKANHQIVSQINKYYHYLYRKLRYGRYQDIQGVIVCNGLDSWSVNEIRKDGHWAFTIVPKNKDIYLERIQSSHDTA